jgi:hypothetical protein
MSENVVSHSRWRTLTGVFFISELRGIFGLKREGGTNRRLMKTA